MVCSLHRFKKDPFSTLRIYWKEYLEERGDVVRILITPRSHTVSPVIPLVNPFTNPPTDRSSKGTQ